MLRLGTASTSKETLHNLVVTHLLPTSLVYPKKIQSGHVIFLLKIPPELPKPVKINRRLCTAYPQVISQINTQLQSSRSAYRLRTILQSGF